MPIPVSGLRQCGAFSNGPCGRGFESRWERVYITELLFNYRPHFILPYRKYGTVTIASNFRFFICCPYFSRLNKASTEMKLWNISIKRLTEKWAKFKLHTEKRFPVNFYLCKELVLKFCVLSSPPLVSLGRISNVISFSAKNQPPKKN